MRKLKLSYQITIIFIAAFIITSILLGVLITRRLDSIYEDNIFGRLESFGKVVRLARDISSYEASDNIAFIAYNSEEITYQVSDNTSSFIDSKSVELLINKAVMQDTYFQNYINTIGSKEIYYTVLNYQGFFGIQSHDVYVVLTDNTLKSQMVTTTTRQIVIASLIAFMLGYLVVIFWITRLVNDTKKISKDLKAIGKNRYDTKIETKRKDEIGELAASIEAMRSMILENEKSKQEIIQGVSHDLKTPVAIISSYAEALSDNMCEKDEAVEIITKQCIRLDKKVTQLLNLTRLGYIDINDKTIGHTNMKKLAQEVAKLYSYQGHVDIELDLIDAEFFGDRESWLIVMQNILDNAIRYAKSKIVIKVAKNKFSISNDGKHIDEKTLPKIFNAYEKSMDGRFGLGMSIVKRTVDLFGYDIKAINEDDGVCFEICKLC